MGAYDNTMALAIYHTGAAEDGEPISDVTYSLGGYRSGTRYTGMTPLRTQPMRGIRIDEIGLRNSEGIGYLKAATTGSLQWKAPGDTAYGTAVAIANGESAVLANADNTQCIRVTRCLADLLSGVESVQLVAQIGNAAAGPDFIDAGTGDTYTAVMLRNDGTAAITALAIEVIPLGGPTVTIATEATVDDAIQVIADPLTPPSGLSFTGGESGLSIPVDGMLGLWIKRSFDATISPFLAAYVSLTYNCGTFTGCAADLGGFARHGDTALEAHLAYVGIDAAPDYTAAPEDTFSGASWAYVAAAGHDYHVEILDRNRYGLISRSRGAQVFRIDSGGEETPLPPGPVEQVSVVNAGAGIVRVAAIYHPGREGATGAIVSARRATHWAIWLTATGVDPDPLIDTPTAVVAMTGDAMLSEILDWTSAAQTDGATVAVAVASRRVTVVGDPPVTTTVDGTATIVHVTASSYGVQLRHPAGVFSRGRGVPMIWVMPTSPVYIDEPNDVRYTIDGFHNKIMFGATEILCWTPTYMRTGYPVKGETVGGAASATVEVVVEDLSIYVSADGVRGIRMDAGTSTISVAQIKAGDLADLPSASQATTPIHEAAGLTYFQAYDGTTGLWFTVAVLNSSGLLTLGVPLR